jgi:hypothetical protein
MRLAKELILSLGVGALCGGLSGFIAGFASDAHWNLQVAIIYGLLTMSVGAMIGAVEIPFIYYKIYRRKIHIYDIFVGIILICIFSGAIAWFLHFVNLSPASGLFTPIFAILVAKRQKCLRDRRGFEVVRSSVLR